MVIDDKTNPIVLVKLIVEQWEILREDLYSGKTEGQSIEELVKKYPFLDQFNQVIEASTPLFSKQLSEMGTMYRGVGVNEDIAMNYYSRLIPNAKHSQYHNRMNPPGETFIYLGVIPKKKGAADIIEKEFVLKTVAAELRVNKGDFYTMASFKANQDTTTIFDMTGNSAIPMDLNELVEMIMKNRHQIPLLMSQYYFNLFNHESIFKPINSEDQEEKAREYAPFQLLAKYIQSKGYGGIKFRSTVHKEGTNLVVFNVDNVKIVESTMERIAL